MYQATQVPSMVTVLKIHKIVSLSLPLQCEGAFRDVRSVGPLNRIAFQIFTDLV